MTGLYLTLTDLSKNDGYNSKIFGQVKAFLSFGIHMRIVGFNDSKNVKIWQVSPDKSTNSEVVLKGSCNNVISRRINLLRVAYNEIKHATPDFLYMRYPRLDPLFMFFLKKVNNLKNKIYVISEIPTFPYDFEHRNANNLKSKIAITIDKIFRKNLKKYIDVIAVIAFKGDVFGIPSVKIENGIDTSKFTCARENRFIGDVLNLIAVGNMNDKSYRHGFDRVLYGLGNYYREKVGSLKIAFHIVGSGDLIIQQLKLIADSLGISDHVFFHGFRHGQELEQIFERSHIAIGCLGFHRIGVCNTSALKEREYAARGIPFVRSADDFSFPHDFEYILKIPSDESPVNMNDVINFATKVYRDTEHPRKIREFVDSHLRWENTMSPIIARIQNR